MFDPAVIFDYSVITALMIAALRSKQPFQFATLIVAFTALFARQVDEFGLYWAQSLVNVIPGLHISEPAWIPIYLIFILQTFMAGILILSTFVLSSRRETLFFWIMAVFLLFNGALVPLYDYDVIAEYDTYVFMFETAAILQVIMAFYYSNGFTKIIRNIWGLVFRNHASISSFQRNQA